MSLVSRVSPLSVLFAASSASLLVAVSSLVASPPPARAQSLSQSSPSAVAIPLAMASAPAVTTPLGVASALAVATPLAMASGPAVAGGMPHPGRTGERMPTQSHEREEQPTQAPVPTSASASTPVPAPDATGRVMFMFGQGLPTIVCAPIHICDIELQAGEMVQGAPHVGDAVRWRISPAVSGSEEQRVTHLIVKPTEPGLDTNLVIPTNRHTYHLRLVSSTVRYVSTVAFFYPEDVRKEWSDLARDNRSGDGHGTEGGDLPNVAVNRLNFNYRIKVVKGRPRFKPLRAMDDGYHTYISMNDDITQGEAPVLIGMSANGAEQMINYRLKGNLYVIDGTVPKMALVSGVGREQERIELTRDPCRARGWLGICWDAKE